jgi:hypothetical protein
VSFYGQLKTYYNREVSKWLKASPGRTVKQNQIISLFCTAYAKAATIANAASGNRPVNADISEDSLLLQSHQ